VDACTKTDIVLEENTKKLYSVIGAVHRTHETTYSEAKMLSIVLHKISHNCDEASNQGRNDRMKKQATVVYKQKLKSRLESADDSDNKQLSKTFMCKINEKVQSGVRLIKTDFNRYVIPINLFVRIVGVWNLWFKTSKVSWFLYQDIYWNLMF